MFDLMRRPSSNLGLSTFEEMDKLFDNFWRSMSLPANAFSLPSVDIYSDDKGHMMVEMPAAGYNEDDIEISVRDGVLEIRGERTDHAEEGDKKRNYMVRESSAGFARRIVLPEGADADKVEAQLDRGLLKITVPVHQPEAKRIKIVASKGGARKLSAKSES